MNNLRAIRDPAACDGAMNHREQHGIWFDGGVMIGRPAEAITTALYLASDASSYTTGTVIELSGGIRSCARAFGDYVTPGLTPEIAWIEITLRASECRHH